ncbi:MAG: 60S ribosomal protein L24 [Trichoglossum hirsutum]|nr:MAG: 60S ribosomal protein L24 [Trichoglossum hirsutum]
MRTYDDTFSGQKIYPGKVCSTCLAPYLALGKLYVRGDSKIFRFQNGKSESLFLQRKNPRRIAWTVLFRRQHKKGISEEVAKKRTRRTVKHQRAIVGASLDVIKERRSQRPEARAAARQAAIKQGKEKKAAEESKKKLEKAKSAAGAARGQLGKIQSKQGAKGAPNKEGSFRVMGRGSTMAETVTAKCTVLSTLLPRQNEGYARFIDTVSPKPLDVKLFSGIQTSTTENRGATD